MWVNAIGTFFSAHFIILTPFLPMHIQDCGLNCHEKCRDQVNKPCTKYIVPIDPTNENVNTDVEGAAVNGDYYDIQVESSNIIYQVLLNNKCRTFTLRRPVFQSLF